MGYISIQINKAKRSADTGASDHIERKTTPKNADPTRTHLNRELVEFPDGVADHTEAISHRIRTAGIRRKITPDQVRAIRIVLSGTHEDMVRVQDEGRLAEWCDDNLQWLYRTFGRENTVSAVLHMDEHTPHIHATVVPIVTDERRKAKKKQTEGRCTYRKKANAVRLCADDLLTRERLVAYHDSYAAAMAKYGLRRGIRGSEARHTTTAQYYRDLKRQTGELEANMRQLQTEQQQAERQLDEVRKEIKLEKLEAAKTEAKAALVAKVGSLLGSGKLKELEADNRTLQGEVAARDESIEVLQQQMQRQQEEHQCQLMELQAKHRREMADKEAEHQKVSVIPEIYHPESQEMVSVVPRVGVYGGVLPQSRLQREADRHAHQRQAVVLRRRTLFGGTQEEVHDRKGWFPSGERPGGQIQTRTCNQWASDWRMVQGTVRQAVFIHSEDGYTAS